MNTPAPKAPKRVNVAILISGSGSNMEALVASMQAPDHPARPALVICNRPKAGGIERAKRLGVPVAIIDHNGFERREDFEAEMDKVLLDHDIDLICCAGFMRVLTPWFVSRWPKRILNIHPSLLPKFKGLNTHARALEANETEHGATVHWVSEELDGGAIIAQSRVPVKSGDTAQSLQERVLEIEHPLYVETLFKIANVFDK